MIDCLIMVHSLQSFNETNMQSVDVSCWFSKIWLDTENFSWDCHVPMILHSVS